VGRHRQQVACVLFLRDLHRFSQRLSGSRSVSSGQFELGFRVESLAEELRLSERSSMREHLVGKRASVPVLALPVEHEHSREACIDETGQEYESPVRKLGASPLDLLRQLRQRLGHDGSELLRIEVLGRVVKPTRSAKRTVTIRRSPAGGGPGAKTASETGSTFVPHDGQNAASTGSALPHEGQLRSSDAPQLAQKRASAAFS
jgi:hypothetical protein